MTDKERLVELIVKFGCEEYGGNSKCDGDCFERCEKCETNLAVGELAEELIENGVIVPPCNVGDTVYCINTFFQNDPRINQCKVDALHITSGKNHIGHKKPSYALVRDINMHSLSSRIYFENFGITAFLDREEAEKALAERSENNG